MGKFGAGAPDAAMPKLGGKKGGKKDMKKGGKK